MKTPHIIITKITAKAIKIAGRDIDRTENNIRCISSRSPP
jgi:hypothetical protein